MKKKQPQRKAIFGITSVLTPSPGLRHRCSPAYRDEAVAIRKFGEAVSDGMTDTDVLEIRLCRYTVGRTQIVQTWTREMMDKAVAA